ncbi:DNA polymerase alpha subunit B [Holothuria leucospilota]|uniref:DNA polymerase alpha subunit B n=1 Tax=Holothuria leucospilota TaxID=206669 RepID=A0A9Q1CIC0_HOLLE|nr:DNA polymerase alpha subunit B [Holothuria leucospilota]
MMPSVVDAEELSSAFGDFSIELTDQDVLDKLVELCSVYRLDAAEISAEWMALSVQYGQLEITFSNLEKLESEVLQKRTITSKKPKSNQGTPVLFESPNISMNTDDDFGLFDAYTPGGKTNSQKSTFKTPDNQRGKQRPTSSQGGTPLGSVSPFVSTPSQKYSSRSNKGEVVARYGDLNAVQWAGSNPWMCKIDAFNPECTLKAKYKYMFQKLTEKAHILNDMIEEMAQQLQEKHNIEELSHVAIPLQEKVSMVGRICCDSVGKLNQHSVILEGSVETSAGKRVPLKLTEVTDYSLFPGQIVALEGINSTGSNMVVSRVLEGATPPFPSEADTSLSEHGPLHVVMAAGPFTTSDSLNHEPLTDLMTVIQDKSPDVCILFGPFVDCNQEQISSGNLPQTFNSLFEELIRNILKSTEGSGTQLVVLPSLRDIHHDLVYPQPPFPKEGIMKGRDAPDTARLHFVSEPSTFTVNGIVFGATSSDVLLHLGKEEISGSATKGDRLGRLMKHIFTQQSYYPIHPPPEDVPIDYAHFEEYAHLTVTPHVFISPSDMRYFIKDIDGSLCINPGRLSKGQGGGTYAEVVIQPEEKVEQGIVNRTAAKIVRI